MAYTAAHLNQIFFIDTRLADYQTLVDQIGFNDVEIILINADEDGFARMATHVAGRSDVGAIHVLGHGSSGQAQLGTATLNNITLSKYSSSLSQIGQSLTENGDILFYGCELAAGEAGENFVAQLGSYTQADIAASNNITGAAQAGGDWNLEYQTGLVEAAPYSLDNYAYTLGAVTFTITVDGVSRTHTFSSAASGQNFVSGEVGWLNTSTGSNKSATVAVSGFGSVWSAISWDVVLDNSGSGVTPTATSQGGTGFTEISGTGTSGSATMGIDSKTDIAIRITGFTAFVANTPPTFTGTTNNVNEGVQGSINLDGQAQDTESADSLLSYTKISGVGALSGRNLVYTPPTIPTNGGNGYADEITTVRVTDPGGLSKDATFYWNVNYNNDPTTWGSPPANQGWSSTGSNSYNWASGASDLDNLVSYSYLSGAPAGFTTGTTISGNPGASLAGTTATINVRASGSTNVDRSFTITFGNAVQLNDAPTSTNDTLSLAEDGSKAFASSDFGTFSDPDSGSLYNSLAKVKIVTLPSAAKGVLALSGTPVVAGAEIAVASLGQLVYTPVANFNGSDSFTYKVNDGLADSAATYTQSITVTSVNDAPVFSNPAVTASVIDTDITDGFAALTGTITASDLNGGAPSENGTISYTISGGTSAGGFSTRSDAYGLLSIKTSTGGYTYTPNATAINALQTSPSASTFTINAADGQGATITQTLTLNVTGANDRPVLQLDNTTNAATSASTLINLPSIDEDIPTQGQTITNLLATRITDADTGSSFGGIVITANAADSATQGTWQYKVSGGTWTNIPTTGLADSTGLALVATTSLRFFPNQDYNGAPGKLTVYATDNIFTGYTTNGTPLLTVNITNSGISATSKVIGTTVNSVNDAPVITSLAGAATLTETAGYDNSATLSMGSLTGALTATDDGGAGNISYTIRGGSTSSNTVTKAGNYGTLTLDTTNNTWTYAATNMVGLNALPASASATETFTLQVFDADGVTRTQDVVITLQGTNDTPVLATALVDQTPTGPQNFSFQLPANSFTDVEGLNLAYTATVVDGSGNAVGDGSLPTWLTFNDSARTFIGTNVPVGAASLYLKVVASDGTDSTSDIFALNLSNFGNQAPVLAHPVPQQVVSDAAAIAWIYKLPPAQTPAAGPAIFTDSESDTLTYSAFVHNSTNSTWEAVPSGSTDALRFDPLTLAFSGNGTALPNGGVVEIRAVDASGSNTPVSTTMQFTLQSGATGVTAVNAGALTATWSGSGNQTYVLPAGTFAFADGGALAFSAKLADNSALPSWLSFNTTSGKLSGNPPADATLLSIVITATDNTGVVTTATKALTLTIANPNDAPTVSSFLPDVTVPAATDWSTTLGTLFADPDGVTANIAFTAQYLNAAGTWTTLPLSATDTSYWLSFNPTTKTFSGNPPANLPALNVKVIGTDTGGASNATTFTLNLADTTNYAFAANNLGAVAVSGTPTQGQNLTAAAPTDTDGYTGTVSYQWQVRSNGTAPWLDVDGARGKATTLTLAQTESGKQIQVLAFYTDKGGVAEMAASTALTVLDVNDPGVVTFTAAPLVPEETITALLSDPDGLTNATPTYQWYRSTTGTGGWIEISGATQAAYTMVTVDGNNFLQARVTYTDDQGHTSTAISAATSSKVTLGAVKPNAVDDVNTVLEAGGVGNSTPAPAPVSGIVLTNDLDDNFATQGGVGDSHTISSLRTGSAEGVGTAATDGATLTLEGAYGTLVLTKASGAYTYTLNQDNAVVQALDGTQTATDAFNYTVTDSTFKSDIGVLRITITGAHDAPVITGTLPASSTQFEDVAGNVDLSAIDISDVDSTVVTIKLMASQGTLAATGADGVTVVGSTTSTLTLSGTPAAVTAFMNTAANVQYTSALNDNGTPGATLAVSYQDSSMGSTFTSLGSVALNITAINDAPDGTNKPFSISEDTPHTFIAADFGLTDVNDTVTNGGSANSLSAIKITRLPGAGKVQLDGVDVLEGAFVAVADITSGKLKFVPDAQRNSNSLSYTSFTFQVQDDGGTANDGVDLDPTPNTFTFSVVPVNDAPVLQDGNPVLTTVSEDVLSAANVGNLVSDLISATDNGIKPVITDADTLNNGGAGFAPEAVGQGMAIYGLSNNGPADGGAWQFSINGGTSWAPINVTGNVVSSSNVLLLSATDKVRFVPDAENATSASINFYAWDEATGTHGTKVDPGARGGSTAFSTASATAVIAVTTVNDAPTLNLDANSSSSATGNNFQVDFLPRGSAVAIVDTDIAIADVDQTSRTEVAQQDTITQAVVAITAGADDNYAGGVTDETLTFKDSGTATTTWSGLTISGNGTTSVTISGTSTWANYQAALQKVFYNNTNAAANTGNRTIEVSVTDGNVTDAGNGPLTATAITTVSVVGVAIVDLNGGATAGADNTVIYTEGDAGKAIATTNAAIDNQGSTNLKEVVLTLSNPADGTGGNAESLFVADVTITSLASTRGITVTGSGTHLVKLTAGTLGVSASDMQTALRTVQYKNISEAPSTTPRLVNVTVESLDHAGVGASSTITLVSVNDAPVVSSGAVAAGVFEGGLATLSITNLNATDIDDTQSTLDFVVTTAPTKGVLFRDSNGNGVAESGEVLAAVPGTGVITSFTQGDLVAGRVKYQQTDTALLSVTDYGSDSFAFKVQDGMENGVVAPTGTHTLNITAVNDAPTLTATASNPTFSEAASTAVALFSASAASAIESAQTLTEIKLTVAGLVNGADEKLVAGGGTTFALQTTVTTPVVGSTVAGVSYAVTISGSTATITLTHAGLTPLQAQTLVDSLQYQNTSNAPSGSTRVVTLISVKDSGGTVESGSIDTTVLSLASTVAIIANDSTPVLATNTGKNVANGALITLTTTELNTTDSDTPSSAIQYTVGTAPTKGTLFKDLNGSGAAEAGETLTATSTFTQADLAAGLIKYRHNGVDDTADSFAFTVKDASTTLASATFALTVTAVTPTSPTVSGTGATTPNSTDGSDVLFTGVVISPPAGETVKSLQFTLVGVRDGNKEFVTINGQAVPMVAGTTTVGNETYVVVANGNGSFTVTVTDITNPGWSGPDASAIVNGARYKNTEVPPTAGVRTATLDSVTDYLADGSTGTPTTVAITSTITLATSTDLWTLLQAEAAVLTPNNLITTLNFTVTGALNGANEFIKINGREVALTPGTTTLNGVTYVVAESPASSGNFTLAITNPAGWTEVQSETLLDDATYSNNANPATAGNRVVTLVSVVEAVSPTLPNVGNPTPNPTLTLVDPNLVATVPTAGGVTVTNTEPTVVTNTTVAVAEGQTVTLTSTHVAATDAQQAAGSLVFKLVSAPTNGTLFRDGNGNGLVETGEAMAANATFTQLELTSGSIKYRHDSSETATDELSFTVSDGIATTTAMSLAFAVSHVNDQPTLSATGASPTYTEATTPVPVALYSAAAAATGDTLGATQKFTTLTLTVSNIADGASEMLLVNGSAAGNRIELSGATASGSVGQVNGTGLNYAVSKSGNTATVTLTHAGLSAAELQTLVNGLAYQNTSTNPTAGARAVNITQLKDDGGGTLPDLDTAFLSLGSTVTVAATNNAPTLTVVANGTNPAGFTIVEGGAQTLTATHLAAADTDTASSNFVYKLTTVPSASGLLYLDNNGNAINDTGDTTLALNSTFTQAELTGGKVRFQHAGGEATTETMAFSVSDGNSSSSSATLTVTLTPVNDAPTLGSLDGDTITYPPLNPAMLIDLGSNATVTDPDSTNFDTGTLRASVYINGDAVHDVLSIKNVGTSTGQISVASNTVSYAGSAIGTYTGGNSGADLVVTLNASANPAAIAALIRALQFNNTQAAPVNNSRGIRISVSDGDGGTSLASQVQINIPVGGPAFLSGSGFYVSENTTLVTVMSASDVVGKMPITYSISPNSTANNTDAAKFSIDATSGTLSFLAAPDFEIPTDSGTNNVYNVIVRASNNESAYTEAALAVNVVNIANESTGATSGDTAGPVFGFATVNASTLVITYTDASHLDAANVPLATAFTVSGNTVTSVAVNATAKTVTLTLGAAVVAGAAVTLTYTDPTGNNDMLAIQDAAGNDAASLASINVSNITPSTNAGGGGGGGITTPVTPDSSKPNNSVTTDEKGNINVTNNDPTVTTINNPKSGTVVTNSGGGNVNLTEPGSILAINNEGTGTITTSGVQNQTSLFINGFGFQVIDLSGLKAGESVTINHTGSGEVDIKNLPDGVIINLTGNGKFLFNDADGSDNNIENLIPSLFSEKPGDGNGDGTSDALQSNVVSFQFLNTPTPLTNPDNALLVFLTLVVDSKGGKIDHLDDNTATLKNIKQLDAPLSLPAGAQMPLGLVSFSADIGIANDGKAITESFSIYADPSLNINGYWKQDSLGSWVNLASSVNGGGIFLEGDKIRLDFVINDGGAFDLDKSINGIIVDPGGVGYIPMTMIGFSQNDWQSIIGFAPNLTTEFFIF